MTLIRLIATLCFVFLCQGAWGKDPSASGVRAPQRNPDFLVPPRLEGRVAFWRDIFSKYGRYEAVVHHREYPQVVFGVVDLRAEALVLPASILERERQRRVESFTREIKADLSELAEGTPPKAARQQQIADMMAFIPGGPRKYRRALQEDLIRSQTGIREKWQAAIERSGRYLYLIENIFQNDFHLPIELTRLPFVESSFDYRANSSVGAAGIWQFMPRTGRIYLMMNRAVDERRDPVRASEAAAKYLREAHDRLGNWPLAVTSYNHGVGGVAKAVRIAGTTSIASLIETHDERPFGFASSNFFPSLLASLECYERRRELFPESHPEAPLKMASTRLRQGLPISWVTQRLGVSADELRDLNYGLLEPVWQGRLPIPQGYELKVPFDRADKLNLLLGSPPRGFSSPVVAKERAVKSSAVSRKKVAAPATVKTYKVKKGDTLGSIASRFGVTVGQLQTLNKVSPKTLRSGQMLRIPGT